MFLTIVRWIAGGFIIRTVFNILRNWRTLLFIGFLILVGVTLYQLYGKEYGLTGLFQTFVKNTEWVWRQVRDLWGQLIRSE